MPMAATKPSRSRKPSSSARNQGRSRKPSTGAEIMWRLIQPEVADLPSEAARAILRFHFPPSDVANYELLSSKVQDDVFTPAEWKELEEYVRVSDLLALLQAKARLSLKKAGLSPDVS